MEEETAVEDYPLQSPILLIIAWGSKGIVEVAAISKDGKSPGEHVLNTSPGVEVESNPILTVGIGIVGSVVGETYMTFEIDPVSGVFTTHHIEAETDSKVYQGITFPEVGLRVGVVRSVTNLWIPVEKLTAQIEVFSDAVLVLCAPSPDDSEVVVDLPDIAGDGPGPSHIHVIEGRHRALQTEGVLLGLGRGRLLLGLFAG